MPSGEIQEMRRRSTITRRRLLTLAEECLTRDSLRRTGSIALTPTGTDMAADTNIANKKFLTHQVVGNKRLDVVEFTVVNGAVGIVCNMRLSNIIAVDFAGQDVERRNTLVTPSGGSVVSGAFSGGAADNGKKVIVEAWGW